MRFVFSLVPTSTPLKFLEKKLISDHPPFFKLCFTNISEFCGENFVFIWELSFFSTGIEFFDFGQKTSLEEGDLCRGRRAGGPS